MHKTNIRRVALALLTGELATRKRGTRIGYNQGIWCGTDRVDMSGHDCQTTACVAGTAVILFGGKRRDYSEQARKIFKLDLLQAEQLFTFRPDSISVPNAKQAAMVLFHLAETGKVDWKVTV